MGFTRHRPDLCSPEKPRVAATFIPLINRLIYGLWGAQEPRSLPPSGGRRPQAAPRLGEDAGGSPNHQGPLRSHQRQGHSNTRKEDLEGGSAGDAGSVWELCCVSITVHEDQLPTGFPPPPSCKPRQVHGEGKSPDRCGKHCRPPVLENQTKPGPKCFPESARGRQSCCPRSLARHRGTGKSR